MTSQAMHGERPRQQPRPNRQAESLKAKERHDYNVVAAYYDANTTPLTDVFGRRALELLDLAPGQSVLEVACGSGTLLPELARRVGRHGSVLGFDQSDGMLELARQKLAAHEIHNARLIRGDAEQLNDVAPASCDRVVSVFGLMYLPDPVAALRRIKAALKPGGRAVIAVWGMPEAVPGLTLPMEAGARVLPPPPIGWLMGTGIARKVLYARLLKDKLGGGKSPMCLAPKGVLDGMLAQAGFGQIRREEPSHVFVYQNLDAYWEVLMGTPARVLIQRYSPAKVAQTKAMIGRLMAERHRLPDGRLGVPMGAVIVSGTA